MVIISELPEEWQDMLIYWKTNMEWKEFWVNMGKIKVLIAVPGLHVLQKSNKDPCALRIKGVGTDFICCGSCSSGVHKRCSGISGSLKPDPSIRSTRCTGQARPDGGKSMPEVTVCRDKLEVAPSFCYHGGCLSSCGGCELTSITCSRATWGKFSDTAARSFTITSKLRVLQLVRQERHWVDAAWRSGNGTSHPPNHDHVERRNGWLKKVQKPDPIRGHGRGRSRKT